MARQAINWKGDFVGSSERDQSSPSDEKFRRHFEEVLNPPSTVNLDTVDIATDITIPILDDPISPDEVQGQIRKLKPNNASGPDGLPPGVFTLLPANWIITLATLFNNIFVYGVYPSEWVRVKAFAIFKKGDKANPSNYRCISVLNSIAKLYDMVLSERLKHRLRPFREQAGAQRSRDCTKHIVTLRLSTSMARQRKSKLFVTFVDFSKAYDLVPRHKLFTVLRRLGCGAVMLAALVAMYRVTESIVGVAVVTATIGVRQDSPTSCLLFIAFVNEMTRSVKQKCASEEMIEWIHMILLMDDTILLATSRQKMKEKMIILNQFCDEYGTKVNNNKTKFFVINDEAGDAAPFRVGQLVVAHCDSYVYLGSPFTCDGSVSSAVKLHAKNKLCHVLKFVSFLRKNNDIPFIVKKRVFDAVLMSSLLYGCESWVGADLRPVVKLYNWGS